MSAQLHPAELADLNVIHYTSLANAFDPDRAPPPSPKEQALASNRQNTREQLRTALEFVGRYVSRRHEVNGGLAYRRVLESARRLEKSFIEAGGDPVAEGLTVGEQS